MTRRSESGRCVASTAWVLCAALASAACADAQPLQLAAGSATLSAGGRRSFATTSHTCAVVAGALQCWGAADRGQTGDGSLARRRPLPVRVAGTADALAVAAGGAHTCFLARGRVACFGDNASGQGGSDRPYVLLEPAVVPGLPPAATQIAAGAEHSCAVVAGRVWCWGRNEAGESGGPIAEGCREPFRVRRCSVAPTAVEGVSGPVTALALGERHGCVLRGGDVLCWGANADAQLGDGTRVARARAAPVEGLPGPATAIAAGLRHSCAIVAGEVFCWGGGTSTPTAVAGLASGARRIAAGGDRSCAAGAESLHCWDARTPAYPIRGIVGPVRELALGFDHGCARLGDDALRCWGENDSGQLGRGAGSDRPASARPIAAWDRGQLRDVDGDGQIRVVCLGDSNTWTPGAEPSWCDRLPTLLPEAFRVVNRGQGGATATRSGSLLDAAVPVAHAIESDAPDVAILAYGTNDVVGKVDTTAIVAALARQARRLHVAGVRPLLALVPPLRSQDVQANLQVQALNTALRKAFPEAWLVDFWTGFGDAELLDRVHWSAAGQARRARVAAEALARFPHADALARPPQAGAP